MEHFHAVMFVTSSHSHQQELFLSVVRNKPKPKKETINFRLLSMAHKHLCLSSLLLPLDSRSTLQCSHSLLMYKISNNCRHFQLFRRNAGAWGNLANKNKEHFSVTAIRIIKPNSKCRKLFNRQQIVI